MISLPMADKKIMARNTASMLLEIQAVHVNAEKPFILTSGAASPVYIDCRKLISFPRIRAALMGYAVSLLSEEVGFEAFDSVAGGETAGIPFAAFLAERMAMPMQYVRKKPKGFGRDARIEGDISEGQRILLVEDLTTDGGSKLNFVEAMRTAGAEVAHTFVIFYYDIFKDTPARLAEDGISLHYLATWWDVLTECKASKRFDPKTLAAVEDFLNNPREWSKAHGGV